MAIGSHSKKSPHALVGRFDRWLTDAEQEAERGSQRDVIIDFGQVEKVSSDELNELIRLQLHLKHGGQQLILANVQETVFQVFTLTRLDRLIELRHGSHFDNFGLKPKQR